MDFLKYDLMVSNRVNVDIDSYEAGPYSAKTSASDLYTAFLELSARVLLVGRIMGDKLMRRDSVDIEKLKADLENSASSLKSALSANINLADRNKDLEEKLEQADAEIGMLRERCSVASQKEEQANDRAAELRREVGELEGKVVLLKSGCEEDSRRIADLERKLSELQDHVIEQHDRGFDLVVRQAAFFYKVPVDEGKFDNRKDFYKGDLLPLADIPDDNDATDNEEEEAREGEKESVEGRPSDTPDVNVID